MIPIASLLATYWLTDPWLGTLLTSAPSGKQSNAEDKLQLLWEVAITGTSNLTLALREQKKTNDLFGQLKCIFLLFFHPSVSLRSV